MITTRRYRRKNNNNKPYLRELCEMTCEEYDEFIELVSKRYPDIYDIHDIHKDEFTYHPICPGHCDGENCGNCFYYGTYIAEYIDWFDEKGINIRENND